MDLRSLPYFEEYCGVWCVEPNWFRAAYDRYSKLDLTVHMKSDAPRAAADRGASGSSFQTANSVAIIRLDGPLTKQESSMEAGTSTVNARRKVRAAAADPNVGAIVLHISSPGGTFSGTGELAADVAAAAKAKPVYAHIDDIGASAAYWIASQAQKVYASPTAFIGSIGTYSTIEDSSKAAEAAGVKVHLITTGAYKGMGEYGTAVNPDQLAEAQRRINEANDHFIRGVATGRGMSQQRVRELADGRVHMAGPAQKLGLIDGVQTLDETIRQASQKSKGKQPMSEQNSVVTEPTAGAPSAPPAKVVSTPATLAELKAGLPGADAAFILAQAEASATLGQAQQAWIAEQNKQLAAAKADLATEKAKAETKPTKKPGVKPVTSGKGESGDADPTASAEDFNAAVRAEMKNGKNRAAAVRAVSKSRPDLQQAYLLSHKENRRSRISALITDRFEEFVGQG